LFPTEDYPDLLVGLTAPDDAAVYRLAGGLAVVSTVDFFPPVVDDAYSFGAIAAANAMSDIYAMGGEPLFAINLAAYPDNLPLATLTDILRGGAEKVREAGAVVAGGHTVTDKEPKYGMAVTGTVDPERIIAKAGARTGDKLILTKALGTGVITTAHKRGIADDDDLHAAIASMTRLNRDASRVARAHDVHAMTDITGFGLIGHAHEVAHLSNVALHLDYSALNWLPGALRHGNDYVFPGGMERNMAFYGEWVRYDGDFADFERALLNDPETSGGLLMAVAPEAADALLAALHAAGDAHARIIGGVEPGAGELTIMR